MGCPVTMGPDGANTWYNTWPPSFPGGSSYHKIPIVTKGEACISGYHQVFRAGMSFDYILKMWTLWVDGREQGWDANSSPHGVKQQAASMGELHLAHTFPSGVSHSLHHILTWCGFLVFVVPGGLFVMQDCHGEAVQLSLLGHIYMFKCVTKVTKVLHFKGKKFSQILHTVTSTTLIWKPQADCQIRKGMNAICQASQLIYDQYEVVCLSRVVLSWGHKILYHKVHVHFFKMIFLRQSPNWNLSGFTQARTKMYFLPFNTVP